VLIAWLRTQGIYVCERHREIKYNSAYHFYDIRLFPTGRDTAEFLMEKLFRCFEENGHTVTWREYTWRWSDSTRIDGVRLWIEAEDVKGLLSPDTCSDRTVRSSSYYE
jgi:hypothetical protein